MLLLTCIAVVEQTFLWPALPPPNRNNTQKGPELAVTLPANCKLGPLQINHATFSLY